MKKKSTYRMLVQSEEKSRNILEMALYAVFALSALLTIWQFAEEPGPMPLQPASAVAEQAAGSRIAS